MWPEHPRSVRPLPTKPEHHHHYHRLHQHSRSGGASHTSTQQSGASSGLDHATGSATTGNPQARSPRSNHWLDAATSGMGGDGGTSDQRRGERWKPETRAGVCPLLSAVPAPLQLLLPAPQLRAAGDVMASSPAHRGGASEREARCLLLSAPTRERERGDPLRDAIH
ncbi:unnamed protein product [Pleuronectes platessa]|uniref:Uncharacterized protein n=1 Tax=Pleuronectes platessa TaxID=8262 RepID=A0A9N7VIY3_PLEPL|nr:unnamed protein product [Pleuronectes platessa]